MSSGTLIVFGTLEYYIYMEKKWIISNDISATYFSRFTFSKFIIEIKLLYYFMVLVICGKINQRNQLKITLKKCRYPW